MITTETAPGEGDATASNAHTYDKQQTAWQRLAHPRVTRGLGHALV